MKTNEHDAEPEADLQSVLDSLTEGILTLDDDGRVTGINHAACKILGVKRDRVLRKGCLCVLGETLCGRNSLLLESVRNRKPIRNYEAAVPEPAGKQKFIEINANVLRDGSGEPSGGVLSIRDITELVSLRRDLGRQYKLHNIVGKSKPMRELLYLIEDIADSNATVLIEGESGTGKELVARAIHHCHNSRSKHTFVAVNCSALAEGLLESELFGHVRGAFTGAVRDKKGRFETAARGTIFLDEIGDISPLIQVKLLRVIQERAVERVGSDKTTPLDVRIIAATNRSLTDLVRDGSFRLDLYYRLRVVPIRLPALRERRDDIPLLVQHFVELFRQTTGRQIDGLDSDAMSALLDYAWPGNVRELENAIEYAFVKCRHGLIGLNHLPDEILAPDACQIQTPDPRTGERRPRVREGITRERTDQALRATGWNISKAAKLLKISRTTLYKRIDEFGLRNPLV